MAPREYQTVPLSKGENTDATTSRNGAAGVKGAPDYRTVVMGFPADLPLSEYQRLFTLEAVEKTGDRWFVQFGALKRYVETHGEEPTAKTEFQGINLGKWLTSQRAAFREKKLAPDKLKLITMLGVSLSNSRATQWERQLIACKAFLEINHRLPSTTDSSANGMKIGEWLAHQRVFFKKGKLPKEKIERFEQLLGSVWEPMRDRWNLNLEAYKDYVEKTGKQPTKRTTHNGINLGIWLSRLRQNLSPLSQDRINSLNALGMNLALNPKQGEKNHDGRSQSQIRNEERQGSISELRQKNLKHFMHLIPNSTALTKWQSLIPEFRRNNQDKIRSADVAPQGEMDNLTTSNSGDATLEDQLRSKYADQTDDEWSQYYLWCKEVENSGTKILAEMPTHKIQDIKAWLRVQWALYRDKKLSARRRQYLKHLRHFEWR